jgi:hypothetical protein
MDLDPTTLAPYLQDIGAAPADVDIAVSVLAGGVSNIVLLACWPGGEVVVKQSLAQLRVAAEWAFDRARIFVERDCLDTLATLLPGAAPTVVFTDEPNFVLAMTVAPPGGEVWRDALYDGRMQTGPIDAAARLLGRMQTASAADPSLAGRFADTMPLVQGRVDPFHRVVAAAHPDLAPTIEHEIDRLLSTRSVLVHGDFSPKNLIAYPDAMLVLDCECAHWGDPAFDIAFLLLHVLLDGSHHPELLGTAAEHAARLWTAYRAAGGRADDEAAVVAELGCLLLARVDGKSPLPGLDDGRRAAIRSCGRTLLLAARDWDVTTALSATPDLLHDPGAA